MDIQEAIEALKTLYPKKCRLIDGRLKGGFDNHDCKEGEALDIAIRALEKQMPKIPDVEGDGYSDGHLVYDTWICPCCGEHYEIDYDNYEYCPKCGQHIDTSNLN